jgi:outer membrane protein assembly factor BamB
MNMRSHAVLTAVQARARLALESPARCRRRQHRAFVVVVAAFVLCIISAAARAQDWPTWGYDNHRSSVSTEKLDLPLRQNWIFQSTRPPQPAWPDPAPQDYWNYLFGLTAEVTFDRAFQLVVAGNAVFFGSSADHKVYCLDARTGRLNWSFFTEGPVRLAPTVAAGKLYIGSDDGCIYCIAADSGKLLWQRRIADDDYRLPGNGSIISLWPIRSGVLVDGDTAYCAAGLFPLQKVFLCALNVADGSIRWRQDVQFSPQGHILASANHLIVPTGRTSPVIFDRADGRYLGEFKTAGGAFALITDDTLLNAPGRGTGNVGASDPNTREDFATFQGLRMVIRGQIAYLLSHKQISALNRQSYRVLAGQRKELVGRQKEYENRLAKLKDVQSAREPRQQQLLQDRLQQVKAALQKVDERMQQCTVWQAPAEYPYSLIIAGEILFAGGEGKVAAFDARTGRELWTATVKGRAYDLAAAASSLFVSTDQGAIYCFAGGLAGAGPATASGPGQQPAGETLAASFAQVARDIADRTGIKKGYCLILGCGRGQLACELARLTSLKIIAVDEDAGNVAAVRQAVDKAGLSGQIVVHRASLAKLPYAGYLANLIVSEQTLLTGKLPPSASEVFRVLRPCGGVAYLGQPPQMLSQQNALSEPDIKRWLSGLPQQECQVSTENGLWLVIRRGPLTGSGQWTHQYAEPGNTACSMDSLVRPPLTVQWFGEPGPRELIDRHHRNVAPLYNDGRLFVPGDQVVFAVDAYNGTALWQVRVPGSRRLGVFLDNSNLAVDDEYLYLVARDKCHSFDVQTGSPRLVYTLPQLSIDTPREWGYLACTGELLLGSACKKGASYTETSREADNALWYKNMKLVSSDYLFALQGKTGKQLWTYKDSLIVNTTITVGGGRVYFVETDSPPALADGLGRMPLKTMFEAGQQRLVALDMLTGRVLYKKKLDVSYFEEVVYLNYAKGILVLSGSREVGQTVHYHVQAFAAESGQPGWQADHDSGLPSDGGHGEYNRHPTIVDETVYTWPYAFELKSGRRIEDWRFSRQGHGCGGISASASCLFWRGGNPWMYDLAPGGGPMPVNKVTRPGCWINIIPAGGLVLIPEASSGCTCGFALQTSIAYVPKQT